MVVDTQEPEVWFSPGPKAPLNPPYGGRLVNLLESGAQLDEVVLPPSVALEWRYPPWPCNCRDGCCLSACRS